MPSSAKRFTKLKIRKVSYGISQDLQGLNPNDPTIELNTFKLIESELTYILLYNLMTSIRMKVVQ